MMPEQEESDNAGWSGNLLDIIDLDNPCDECGGTFAKREHMRYCGPCGGIVHSACLVDHEATHGGFGIATEKKLAAWIEAQG